MMGIYYRLPSQEEELFKVSKSYEMALMEDFSFLDTCWKNNTAKQSQASS